MYSTIVANLTAGVRRERWQNRDWLVAPLVMVVEGVLEGSKGPLFYPVSELAANLSAWDGTPIVLNHPVEHGRPISAHRADVLAHSGLGVVRHPRIDGTKLKGEGWFNVELTRRIAPQILSAIESGRKLELSTGLVTDNQPSKGSYFGRDYIAIARNYRPDHLAILPDSVGACSLRDGCGVLNSKEEVSMIHWLNNNARTVDRTADLGMVPPVINWREPVENQHRCSCGKELPKAIPVSNEAAEIAAMVPPRL